MEQTFTKKRIIRLVVYTALLIPFRLPISVLFVRVISAIANSAGELSPNILASNVVITKMFYDIGILLYTGVVLNAIFIDIYNTHRENHRRMGKSEVHEASTFVIIMSLGYLIYDLMTTYKLYFLLNE